MAKQSRQYLWRVAHGLIKNPGVGSGGDQRGEKNPSWKGGISPPQYRQLKTTRCERCGNRRRKLVGHHRDRNRANNCLENIETLCYPCHRREHLIDRKPITYDNCRIKSCQLPAIYRTLRLCRIHYLRRRYRHAYRAA